MNFYKSQFILDIIHIGIKEMLNELGQNMEWQRGGGMSWELFIIFVKSRKYVRGKLSEVDMK